jgi:methyl coenzyme M reductase alpha subunit
MESLPHKDFSNKKFLAKYESEVDAITCFACFDTFPEGTQQKGNLAATAAASTTFTGAGATRSLNSHYSCNYIPRYFGRLQFYEFELGIHKHAHTNFLAPAPETSKTADLEKKRYSDNPNR